MNLNINKLTEGDKRRKIYIVLTQTKTYPARAIRLYTNEPYAHASIAFDENLDEMYSFARRGLYNPFNAGFIREYIDRGVFGRFRSTTCSIFQLRITEDQYKRLREEIEIFNKNKDSYSYNYLGLIGAAFNIPVRSKNRYFCSQFVAYILEKSGIHIFDKNYALIKPRDIRINPHLEIIYQGKLSEYRIYRKNFQTALEI
ncbi:hypothetical protein DFR55_1387 [Herbinix hemicellulosilytica]|uniref:Permuted papain-like amidase YaeF/Yiix C92 family enzyme n=1 Tax=Herbinix hemicellulosilytica TaxID=1564487 RepID=A0A0H5SFC0_HERHM|nr:hypothetical protein [Herbinix hemicellulosilytica]RBP56804.1 hypothetical protein DFR55_1387 [Herbinix hemicellulosilytica]CRZ34187.1 hypothetical protein HHT355_0984 [Herbinix hemicellulosilytica]